MGILIPLPTTDEFSYKAVADGVPNRFKLERCDIETREGFLAFRMATNGDDEKRSALLSKRKFRINREEDSLDEEAEINPMVLAKLEVWLTLIGTDFALPGVPPLEFETVENVARVKDRAAFEKWWSKLPPGWAQEVYRCCLEVNPLWMSKSASIL